MEDRTAPALYMVSNTADSGAGSLREAIGKANSNPGADTVGFDAGVSGTIALVSGELFINDGLAINGPGASVITVSGNNASRVFDINAPGVGTPFNISGLTISGGKAADKGGGILIADLYSTLTISQCAITGNTAAIAGGGISMAEATLGSLNLQACTVSNNLANSTNGGGINLDGANPLTISNSTISGNQAQQDGGGIYFFNGGSLSLDSSTVAQNKAVAGTGGGIYFFGAASGSLLVKQCTISGNYSGSYGGGITLNNFTGALGVFNSTITNNTAASGGGGGIARPSGTGDIGIASSIVSGNTNSSGPDIFSTGFVSCDWSAIGSPVGFVSTGDFNLPYGKDLKLGPLQNNGGGVSTHMPAFDSPVVNVGNNTYYFFATDQRGPGYPRVLGGTWPDIGAVEVKDLRVRNANDSGTGSLRQAVLDANAAAGSDAVDFDPSYFSSAKSINLTTGQIEITEDLYVFGIDGVPITVDAKGASRVFRVATTKAGGDVRLIHLTLTGGNAANGGAIEVANSNAIVRLAFSTVTGNTASGRGGGVYVAPGGFLDLQSSTISNNTAGIHGGGIYFFSGGGLSAQYSTISGNKSTGGGGGGVYFFGTSTFFDLTNTTISGNTAYVEGGGIAFRNFNGTMSALSCTITANHALGSFGGVGGGIANNSALGKLDLNSTIVSGNINGTAADISSPGTVTANYCAIGENKGFTLNGTNNLPYGASLYLGPLQNNGGRTFTHAFAWPASPLLNAGSKSIGLFNDQRFGDRVSGGRADIGAVELQFFMVTNANDSGTGSLRDAVDRANQFASSDDFIFFDSTVFATAKTIGLTTGQITITDSVSIVGASAPERVTVTGNSTSRVFSIDGPGIITVDLSGLSITGGFAPVGGAISVTDEKLALRSCEVYGNYAHNSAGGGIWLGSGAQFEAYASVIRNNTGFFFGGGIHAHGSASIVLEASTISGNTAGLYGGGLMMYAGGNLQILRSTISGNQADISGGGLCLQNELTTAIIRNSTISSNTAKNFGGGVDLRAFVGLLDIYNTTFTLNTANKGGGIARESGLGSLAIESTIVSGDSATAIGPDLYTAGTLTAKTSLIGSIAGVTTFVSDAVTTLLLGKSPLLGPLQNNGGLTNTHSLLTSSPAISNGSNPWGFTSDQRDLPFKRSVGSGVDIGAFELQPAAKVSSVVIGDGTSQRSMVTQLKITFDSPVVFNGAPAAAFTLIRQSDSKAVNLNVVMDPTNTNATITFTGGAVDNKSLADGRYTLTALAAQFGADGLDGNGDGTGGDNYVLASAGTPNPPTNIFRLFGDANGDGTVAANDFIQFRLALGGSSPIFDFDNDGAVAASDFIQFRLRFGGSI